MLLLYMGGLGELVCFIRPPAPGRTASFRLRCRFVDAVRAGGSKLGGHMWNIILIARPPEAFRAKR